MDERCDKRLRYDMSSSSATLYSDIPHKLAEAINRLNSNKHNFLLDDNDYEVFRGTKHLLAYSFVHEKYGSLLQHKWFCWHCLMPKE